MLSLDERARRTEHVVAKYRGRSFDWSDRRTCIHLARAQARALGHRPPAIGDFRSAIGARTALKRQGFDTLEALLDSMFPRIAPASMWVGDLALVPGEPPFDAIAIADGTGTLLMYHQRGVGLCNVKNAIPQVIGAWRL